MQDVMSREGHKRDYWSSYANVHSRLGLEREEGVARVRESLPSYNILTGKGTELVKTIKHLQIAFTVQFTYK